MNKPSISRHRSFIKKKRIYADSICTNCLRLRKEQRFIKRDWVLFRSKIGSWQEAYIGRLCDEYIELLSGDGDPSEKFWKLDKRIRSDKRNPGVQLEMTRTNFIYNIIALINNDVISIEALEDFSDELKETVNAFLERQNWNYSDED